MASNTASTSDLVISQEQEIETQQPRNIIFRKKDKGCKFCAYSCLPFVVGYIVLHIVYLAYSTDTCVLYINGHRNATLKENTNCSSLQLKYANQTDHEVRTEKYYPRSTGYLIAFIVCLVIAILVWAPCNRGNYISCWHRTTCCCRPVSLKDAINRYMFGYISDESQFQDVVGSGQESLDLIIERLQHFIPEVTFDVLKTGSLVERLGKPTALKLDSTYVLPFKSVLSTDFDVILPIKSVLSTDFDVMLTPQTILASTEEPQTSQTLFNVVPLQNITPGFVWLKLNKDYQESRNKFWRNLCNEFTFADGSKGIYLSSLEVRNVFEKGMKRIKRKETGCFDFFKKMADKGVNFEVRAQGPAVTVEVYSRESVFRDCGGACRPTLFYGDFIFALRCIGWPQEAREWPLRQRFWPPSAVIQEIMTYGYHVVPKTSHPILDKTKKKEKKKTQNENQSILEYEWRLSYSKAELVLSRHIPPVARTCFLALKATIKRHDDKADADHGWFSHFIPSSNNRGLGISSYHLKTALYWALELNPPDFWCEERIEECFMKLVDTLLECVKNQHCSHYFMPQVNLMASLQPKLDMISTLLSKIKAHPASYVSSTNLRCQGNLAACFECMCYRHGEDTYIDVY